MAKKKRVPKPTQLSLAELQRLMDSKASELSDLKSRRATLQKELSEVDRQIRETEGVGRKKKSAPKKKATGGTPTTTKGAAKKKKKVALKKKKKGTRRGQNKGSVKDFAVAVLSKESQGLPLDTLAQRILDSGYKTSSTNFKNTLYQSLYNERKAGKTFNYSDKTGNWTLK